jgi:hypothetical protein
MNCRYCLTNGLDGEVCRRCRIIVDVTDTQREYILRCYWRSERPKYIRGIAKDLGLPPAVVERVVTAKVEADARRAANPKAYA